MQPAAQVAHLAPALERGERVEERLLDRVLSPPVRCQPARLGLELTLVAPDDRGERSLAAGLDQGDELIIGLGVEQPVAALEQAVRDHHGHVQPPDACIAANLPVDGPTHRSAQLLHRFRAQSAAAGYSVGRTMRKTPSTTV